MWYSRLPTGHHAASELTLINLGLVTQNGAGAVICYVDLRLFGLPPPDPDV